MRKNPAIQSLFLGLGLAITAPAQAAEYRAEGRVGGAWTGDGGGVALVGFAAGIDVDLGTGFAGLEASADFANGHFFVGSGAVRLGAKLSQRDKLYAIAGITTGSGFARGRIGGGYQHRFGRSTYSKIEYSHGLGTHVSAALMSFGFTF